MIDERINKSLTELEKQLKDVEAARKQVQNTINAFDGLKSTTLEYVTSLSAIKLKLNEIVKLVAEDYTNKVKDFEKDREAIVNKTTEVTEKLDNRTDEVSKSFELSVKSAQTQILISVIINVISMLLVGYMAFFK